MADRNTPVLVGAAQLIQRDVDPLEALEPLAVLEQVVRDAAGDAQAGEGVLRDADTIAVVLVPGWRAKNAPRLLAERLGARPAREYITALGGEGPLLAVNRIADEIASGVARVAVIAGSNHVKTIGRARAAGVELRWESGGRGEPTMIGVQKPGNTELEREYGLGLPALVYPIFENALRAHRGLDLDTHLARIGALMSRFSEVASKNPYAWFPTVRSAEEIITPSPSNRMVAYPYTKYLNAVMATDQAAGALMMSADAARSYGIPEDRWVYWWSGANAVEKAWFPSQRPDFAACPALRAAAQCALDAAGMSIDDVDVMDFYSCFPVAVEMACEMLGIDESDPRGLTVTGGLPYAGGPGNNYTLHSLAGVMERLRGAPGSTGLLTGNGWYLTKHSAVVLASAPKPEGVPSGPAGPADVSDAPGPIAVSGKAQGKGTLETYTALYERDGTPSRGIVIGRLEEGTRFIANTPDDRDALESFVAVENVGRDGVVTHRDGCNRFEPS